MSRRRKSMLHVGFAGGLDEAHTAFAGAGLLIEAYRQAGIGERAEVVLPRKRSAKGLSAGQHEYPCQYSRFPNAFGTFHLSESEHLRAYRAIALSEEHMEQEAVNPAIHESFALDARFLGVLLGQTPSIMQLPCTCILSTT